jgi:tRNA-dihydrouridine synthase B
LRIGPYQLANNLVLAPMAGVTDRPFRQLCRRLGAGLAVSEMVSANCALHATGKTLRRLDHAGEETPVSVQIVGADPRVMADGARANVDRGAQIIDINMGCPAKKVCRVAAGSALLQEPRRVDKILRAVVNAVTVPVTLKIRTGWDPEHRNGLEIARIAEDAGVQALAVHGRTRACRFAGRAEYDTIRQIKQSVSIPVIANGDITGPEQARRVLDETGADALMIGRAAQGRPWIFLEIEHYLRHGKRLAKPPTDWVRDTLLGHLEALYDFYGEHRGVRIARKHLAWYSKTHPGGEEFRRNINQTESVAVQRQMIRRLFDQNNNEKGLAA